MCGIAAYFGNTPPDDRRLIGSLAHRGPNGSGAWRTALAHGAQLQLVHTRLSILDLSEAGAQPMGLRVAEGSRRSVVDAGLQLQPFTSTPRSWRAAGPAELRELSQLPTSNIPRPTPDVGLDQRGSAEISGSKSEARGTDIPVRDATGETHAGAKTTGRETRATTEPVHALASGPTSNFQLPTPRPTPSDSAAVGREGASVDGPALQPQLQPFTSTRTPTADPAVVVSFNGEIYNYRELRAELAALGHSFRSSGDTEVVLRGYAEWGTALFAKLDGMFALALFDAAQQRLVLARDHAGIKPLYYARTTDGGLLFASEVRTITGSGAWSGGVDRDSVADFLQFGSFQEPRTLWDGLRAFPPGHWGYVRLDEGAPAALQLRPYWLPEQLELSADASELAWIAEHDATLRTAVAEQLASDVPLGVYLSGGIDSTLLTELAADAGGRGRISAFTLAGAATENDEAELAAAAAKRAGVEHKVVHLAPADLAGWVRDGLAAMDQPSSDGINTFLVSRASRQAGLVVALGGTGADELHGAYGHAKSLARLHGLLGAAGPLRGAAVSAAVAAARLRQGAVAGDRLRALCAEAPSAWRMAYERRRFFTGGQRGELWPAGAGVAPRWFPPFADENAFLSRGVREQVRLTELRGYLLNTLLRDADWATMANQQELRVPFLGRRYMECILRRPERATARDGVVKKPRLAALLSPEARRIASLPKRGFTLNYTDLLRGPLREEFAAAAATLNRELGFTLDPGAALAQLGGERSGKYSRRLWALFALGRHLGK